MTKEDLEKVRKTVVRRYPISAGLALKGVPLELTTKISTAAVAAKKDDKGVLKVEKVMVNPDFFDMLTFSQRVFVLAHEACHIALKHFARSMHKPVKDARKKFEEYCKTETDEKKRKAMEAKLLSKYNRIWNIATDACINAFLKKDGFDFPEDLVDPQTGEKMEFVYMEDGLYKSAEKIYDYLVKKEEEKEKEQQQEQQNQGQDQQQSGGGEGQNQQQDGQDQQEQDQSQSQSGSSSEGGEESQDGDDSESSEDENEMDNENNSQSKSKQDGQKSSKQSKSHGNIDEIDIDNYKGFDSHEEWKGEEQDLDETESKDLNNEEPNEDEINEEEVFEKEMEERNKQNSKFKNMSDAFSKIRENANINGQVKVEPLISWKVYLRGAIEQVEDVWGYRRSSRSHPNSMIQERVYDTAPDVEVILDTSGSISSALLKGFLLQLYPIFESIYGEEPTMKVGCFSDSFYGFTEIRNKKDIMNFHPYGGGGTNFEEAAKAFSKDPGRTITKIVFTDGCLGYPQKTRVDDIIWVVFGNQADFKPLGGRIIKVNNKDYNDMISDGHRLWYDPPKSL